MEVFVESDGAFYAARIGADLNIGPFLESCRGVKSDLWVGFFVGTDGSGSQ